LAALLLILAAHVFPAPTWWQTICDTAVAILLALLFCSFGSSMALAAILAERRDRWSEHVGRFLSVLGGVALAALGLVGAWMFFRSSVRGF